MQSHNLVLNQHSQPFGIDLQAKLPDGAAGQWCTLRLTIPGECHWWAKLELADEARGQVVREVFLGKLHGPRKARWRQTLVHVPQNARAVALQVFRSPLGQTAPQPPHRPAGPPHASLAVLGRTRTAATLLRRGWRTLPAALAGSTLGAVGRLRAILGQAPARAGEAPPYAVWVALFEAPPESRALQAAAAWDVQVLVVAGAPVPTAASVASAAAQLPAASRVAVVSDQADWAHVTSPWAVLLQAGETLAPGAIAAFALAAQSCPWAGILTADCDRLTLAGVRTDPLFKPGPDPLLLRSGLPVAGACACRWPTVPARLPLHGHAARLVLALQNPPAVAHVPQILSHIRPDCQPADPAMMADIGRAGQPPGLPPCPSVTILIPTAARAAHVARCVQAVATGTDYADFSVALALSSPARPRILRRLTGLSRVATISVNIATFNYALVNNAAAACVTSELLLLMNDDVAPIGRDWLAAMVAHMRDPSVGVVGARLLYGNDMVQHEGVVMGLANLCEHAGRLRSGADPGPYGIGLLDRQVAAVTGACLLIRTALYRDLGGMDGAYAVALNDVDLCLRAREAGWRVVFCAHASLHHYESLSLGRHYAGERSVLEPQEVQRLRRRFSDIIAADPCYSPLASLQPGREWQPAFPPRAHHGAVGVAPLPSKPLAIN